MFILFFQQIPLQLNPLIKKCVFFSNPVYGTSPFWNALEISLQRAQCDLFVNSIVILFCCCVNNITIQYFTFAIVSHHFRHYPNTKITRYYLDQVGYTKYEIIEGQSPGVWLTGRAALVRIILEPVKPSQK